MPVHFLVSGTVVVDTVVEAAAFERLRAAPKLKKRRIRTAVEEQEPIPEGTWEGFCVLLRSPAATRMRKILALIKGRGELGMSVQELSKAVGDPLVQATSGTVSGVAKNARKAGIGPDDVIERGADGKLRPGPLLQSRDPPLP